MTLDPRLYRLQSSVWPQAQLARDSIHLTSAERSIPSASQSPTMYREAGVSLAALDTADVGAVQPERKASPSRLDIPRQRHPEVTWIPAEIVETERSERSGRLRSPLSTST
jgi:hypothetical protein